MNTNISTNNNYKAYFLLTLTALFWQENFLLSVYFEFNSNIMI